MRTQSQSTTMKRSTQILLFLLLLALRHVAGQQEIGALSELPLGELLAQKKLLRDGNLTEDVPVASAFVGEPHGREISDLRRKTFYEEDYESDEGHVHKKGEHKFHDILNTSIMALSYLAFGGYLLCMIASALREKRRRITAIGGSPPNNQFAHVLQHYVTLRPPRPFNRFPAVTLHQGGKKRRRRSPEAEDSAPLISIIDYVDSFAFDSN